MTISKLNCTIISFVAQNSESMQIMKKNVWTCNYNFASSFACAFDVLSGREGITDQGIGK
jgi:hypothetical protein